MPKMEGKRDSEDKAVYQLTPKGAIMGVIVEAISFAMRHDEKGLLKSADMVYDALELQARREYPGAERVALSFEDSGGRFVELVEEKPHGNRKHTGHPRPRQR